MRPCAKSGLVVIFMHLTPHLLVTLFRIRVTFLTTLFRREITPLHIEVTFGVQTCIPTSNSNELGLKVMRLPRGNLATLVTWADSRR